MAYLVLAGIGAGAAIGFEQVIELPDHFSRHGIGGKYQNKGVDASHPVGRGLQCSLAHPQHPETAIVRHQIARRDREDVIGRKADPDNPQVLTLAVDDRGNAVARAKRIGFGKGFVGDDLVGGIG